MPIVVLKGKAEASAVVVLLETFEVSVLQGPIATSFQAKTVDIAISQGNVSVIASGIWNDHSRKAVTAPVILVEIELDSEKIYFSSQDTELVSGEFYDGRVIQFGTLSRSISDTDGHFQISDVTLILANTDGKFSGLPFTGWLNRPVNYAMGFQGYERSEFMWIFKGVISDFQFNNTLFELSITDATQLWLDKDYGHILDPADWPNAAAGVAGTKMPIIYGDVKDNG